MSSTKRRALLAAAAAAVVVFTALRLPETRRETFWDNHRSRTQNHTIAGLGPAEEGAWRGSFHFVQLADPQLGMLHRDASWHEELAMLSLAVEHVNRLQPRFVVVSGDLINGFPGEPAIPDQVDAFEHALARLDPSIPLVLEPGNHDLGQRPTEAAVHLYQKRFGDDYLRFWVGGVLFVSLNSQLIKAGGWVHLYGSLQDPHEKLKDFAARVRRHASWAAEAFETRAERVVVLSHICPFVGSPDENEGWANWPLPARRAVLAQATRAGAGLWLCGHLHGNAVARHGRLEIVTSSAVGSMVNWTLPPADIAVMKKPDFRTTVGHPAVVAGPATSGLRVVRVDEGGFRHRWYPLADVPARLEDCNM